MKKYSNTINFIKELYDNADFVPLHIPTFNGNEKKYLNECIDSTFVSSVGKFVDLFEEKVAAYTGAKHAIVCVNGTNALHLALILAGVENGDEVITQPLTFIATANAIAYSNATPIFVDVDRDTMGLSPQALETYLQTNAKIENNICINQTTGKRIKACLPMHTFGHACRIEEIITICKRYHIEVVEDAAEAMGSFYKGQHLGTFGTLSAISFNGNKIMTTGGGGIILTNDDNLAKQAKHLSTQAKVPHQWEYEHDSIGYNYRMPNINAALGLAQLEQINHFIANKRETAHQYNLFFQQQQIHFFKERDNEQSNYWLNAIIFNNAEERNLFLEESNQNGVMTRPIWKLMNQLSMFKDCPKGDLTNAEWLANRVVNIPSSVK